jgi:hypothetical protein
MVQRFRTFICGSRASDCGHAADGATQFIIATLPDPTRTHLALFFDRSVDAIEQGIQDSGYLFDRAIMPWDTREHPESADILQRIVSDDYQRAKETWPGVMVFRRSPDQPIQKPGSFKNRHDAYPKQIVVLVAGEYPTGGIHQNQFRNAISLIHSLSIPAPHRLLILGPTFSGSLSSLSDLVLNAQAALHGETDFHTFSFSGTVSSWKSMIALRRVEGGHLTFASFQENDEYILRAIKEYVQERLGFDVDGETAQNRHFMALLSEDETAYGSQSTETGKSYLQLYFPREISQLRSAYQGMTSDQPNFNKQPALTLPLNLENTGGQEDTVATYSSRHLPISQESVLLGLVNELRAQHVRFVVLRATDPMDFLFLARYLRKAYPQGRIITMGSDLLFARETQDSRLFGILAATVYPQVPRLDGGPYKDNEARIDRVFPSSFSTGLYNATRALVQLNPDDTLVGSQNSDAVHDSLDLPHRTELYHYNWYQLGTVAPPETGMPPVHLTALGHNGFWPLYVSQPAVAEPGDVIRASSTLPMRVLTPTKSPQSGKNTSRVTEEWKVFQVLLFACAIFLIVCVWKASALSHENVFSQFNRGLGDHRSGVIATLAFAMVLLLEIALWPDWTQQFVSPWYLRYAGTVLLFILVISIALDILCRHSIPWLVSFVAAVGISIVVIFRHASSTTYLDERYVFRSVHLLSGLSPVLPLILLLASVVWAAWHTTTGTALLDNRLPKLPYLKFSYFAPVPKLEAEPKALAAGASTGAGGEMSFASVAEQGTALPVTASPAFQFSKIETRPEEEQGLLRSVGMLLGEENESLFGLIKPTLFHPWVDPLLAAIGMVTFILIDHDHPVSTLEPRGYCRLIAAIGCLCSITLIGMTWRMWLLWRETKLLLTGLDSRIIRRAFTRIGGISAKPFQIGTNSESDFSRLVSRGFEAAKCVTNRKIISGDEIYQTLDNLRKIRASTESKKRRGLFEYLKRDQAVIEAFSTFQKAMANAVGKTLVFLIPKWASAKVPVLDEQNTDPSRRPEPRPEEIDDDVRVAEHFVCTHYVNFILMVLIRIRAFMTSIVGMYVLIVLAFTVYPFEPSLVLRTIMAILLLFIVGIAAMVYGGMHRDVTLSHIADTVPGELGGDFWLRMTSFVVLPLFSLAAAAFPEFNRFLFSWLEPALQALK